MSFLTSSLRSAALVAATLFLAPTPFVSGTATVLAVTAATTATFVTASEAQARPKVRDHRTSQCRPGPNRGCPR